MLGVKLGQTRRGVLTQKPSTLSNDYFASLLDMGTEWMVASSDKERFEGCDRKTGVLRWTHAHAREPDLWFERALRARRRR